MWQFNKSVGTKKLHLVRVEFSKDIFRLIPAESRGAAFPIGGAAPRNRLLVGVTVEATRQGEGREAECDEECYAAIHCGARFSGYK